MPKNTAISEKQIYLERMSKPLQEKLRVVDYFPANSKNILDVGCADGTITLALAEMFPETDFLGIDLEQEFIDIARKEADKRGINNVRFRAVYLRDLLAEEIKFDAITFISVLHEFFSYGEGISSVLKALADAHELLKDDGEIVIRDMILNEYTKNTSFQSDSIRGKIEAVEDNGIIERLRDFESIFGLADSLYVLNHFLLKYMYSENWDRESAEHYVPVTFEQYQEIFSLLGMDLQFMESYLIPYLENKWKQDFRLTKQNIKSLSSTGFVVARKK